MMRVIRACSFMIFLSILLTGCTGLVLNVDEMSLATAAPTAEVLTLESPEEAIGLYFDGIVRHNLQMTLQACAIEEMATHFDLAQSVERLGGMMNPASSLAPADYPFYVEINRQKLSSNIANQVNMLALSLLSGEAVSATPLFDVDANRVDAFVGAVDPARLAAIRVAQIRLPDAEVMQNPAYLESTARSGAVLGADEATERVVLFAFEDKMYFVGFTLLRYGDRWKISSQSSPLGNTDPLGTPIETTEEEFSDMFSHE